MYIPKRSVQLVDDQNLIVGLEKHFPKGSLQVAGKSYTMKEIVSLLKERVAVAQDVKAAQAILHEKVKTEEKQMASTQELVNALRLTVRALVGTTSPVLSDFGMSPRKQAPAPTAEELVMRKRKAKATREARHTMSDKQKKAIKGVVTPEIAPPTNAPTVTTPSTRDTNGMTPHAPET